MQTRKISRIHTRNHYPFYKVHKGGSIFKSAEFSKIVSIGYEFECGDLIVTNLGFPSADNPKQSKKQFLIPSGSQTPEYLNDKKCNTVGNYTCILSTETDSPLGGVNETHSKLYDFEQLYLKQRNAGVDIDANTIVELLELSNFDTYGNSLENVFVTHTEILFTVFDNKNSCQDVENGNIQHSLNDETCILSTMKTFLDTLHTYFIPATELFPELNEYEESGVKLSFFRPNPSWISKPIYYTVPTINIGRTVDIYADTRWVPQMTYGVKVGDILSVTSELAKLLEKENLVQIIESMKILNMLMAPAYYEKSAKSTKTKKSKKLSASAPSIPSELFKEVREKIKNVLFFAVYYFFTYYFYTHSEGIPIESIKKPLLGKNIFCFTLRHSIFEILDYYMQKYPEEMHKLNDYLRQNIIANDHVVKGKDPTSKLISYVCRSFGEIFKPDYVYVRENHVYEENRIGNEKCAADLELNDGNYYIFSKLLKCQSNYFDFDAENETVLIEYRCFHRNIIQSYNSKFHKKKDKKDLSIHKPLNEWKEMIDKLYALDLPRR